MKPIILRLYPLLLSVWYASILKTSVVAVEERNDRRFLEYKQQQQQRRRRQRRRTNHNRQHQSQRFQQQANIPLSESELEEILGHPIGPNVQVQYVENAWGASDSSTPMPSLLHTSYAPTGKSGKGSKGSKSDHGNEGDIPGKSGKGYYSMPPIIGKSGKSSSPVILIPSPTVAPSSSIGSQPTYSPVSQSRSEMPSSIANIDDSSSIPSNLPSGSDAPSSLESTAFPSIARSELPSGSPSTMPSDAPSASPLGLSEAPSNILQTNEPTTRPNYERVTPMPTTGEFVFELYDVVLLLTLVGLHYLP